MEETNISQILKACRQKAGITQAQFAETIGVKRSAYAYYESGRTKPKFETLKTIAKVYNLDLNTLLATEKNDSLNQTNDSKINFDLKDFNDNFYERLFNVPNPSDEEGVSIDVGMSSWWNVPIATYTPGKNIDKTNEK